MAQFTTYKETGRFCRICGNVMIHILVENTWVCVGHNNLPEVTDYDEQILKLFTPKPKVRK